ncbi:MAG: helix-turn-helix transcriptional regulator [Verrucomicrobiota bacterium]
MPVIVRNALYNRLQKSEMLGQLKSDVGSLAGVRLELLSEDAPPPEESPLLNVPFQAGTVLVGYLQAYGALEAERAQALERWLRAAVESMALKLTHLHHLSDAEALPGSIARAAQMLRERYAEALNLGMVAREVGLSRERLSRLFHESLGITFSDYLNLVRLQHCRERLRRGAQTIADIAFSCGFQSLSQFNRRFKAAENLTPREFQRLAD